MKIIDIIILVILAIFAISGFKKGVLQSLVSLVGFIIILVLAYNLKNVVGDFFVLNLPFMKFGQFLGGASSLNIIMYQALAFAIILVLLSVVYLAVVSITGIIEKILKMTIVLGIPSKLLGLFVGFIEGYMIVYLLLFFLAQPFWKIEVFENSDYANFILSKTPVLSGIGEKTLEIYNEVYDLTKIKDSNELDLKMADIILKENVTSVSTMQKLVNSGKIKINGIENVLNKYS